MIYKLQNSIQEYAWGSRTILPQLLGLENKELKPLAELWMGAHPLAPSQLVLDNAPLALSEFITRTPQAVLGEKVAARFGNELPFLFKVLAIEKPLSIQAHPNPLQAREGFERENALNIPLNAPFRNYKDANQKQEIICALTPFWLMQGFRPAPEIVTDFELLGCRGLASELACLRQQPDTEGLKRFFKDLLQTGLEDKQKTNLILREIIASPQLDTTQNSRHAWLERLSRDYPADIGALLPLLLHVAELKPGEAVFIPPGVLHTYLSGAGVELMTNSDNVMRGGLTPKHIDVDELVRILDFSAYPLAIISPQRQADGAEHYPAPADEFRLSRISLKRTGVYDKKELASIEILLSISGQAQLTCPQLPQRLDIRQGEAVLISAQAGCYRLQGEGELYIASVPV